jgi:hypothetical protein
MKHLFLLLLITPLLLVSCSKEEAISEQNTNKKMLESYVIKKNANGSYTLTHVVTDGVGTIYYDDEKINEVQLYFDGKATSKTSSRDYNVTNNELNIKFNAENHAHQPQIKIIDDNTFAKGTYGLLDDYTITENSDGTISLTFVVDAGVDVKYGFNETEGINEIILSLNSEAIQQTFVKTYTRPNDGILKIDFVQPNLTKEEGEDYKKPRIVMIES